MDGRACAPMFEAILKDALGPEHVVESASAILGTEGAEPHEEAVIAMRDIGLDISGYRTRWIGTLDLSGYDRIYCMHPGAVLIVKRQMGLLSHSSSSVVRLLNEPDGIGNPVGKGQDAYSRAQVLVSFEVYFILRDF